MSSTIGERPALYHGTQINLSMRHKRRLKITVTRRERLYRRSEGRTFFATSWCLHCNGEFSLLTPGLAAELLSVSTRMIYRMVESGRVHFFEATDGELFICLNSLLLAESNIDCKSGVNQ